MPTKSDSDNISDEEKLKQTKEGLKAFYASLEGENDINKIELINVLFEELFKKNNILLY